MMSSSYQAHWPGWQDMHWIQTLPYSISAGPLARRAERAVPGSGRNQEGATHTPGSHVLACAGSLGPCAGQCWPVRWEAMWWLRAGEVRAIPYCSMSD